MLIVTGVAMIIPDFTDFLNIAGAMGCGVLAFIFPPLLRNKVFKDTLPKWKLYSNYLIIIFGAVGSVLSIYTSIKQIVDNYHN